METKMETIKVRQICYAEKHRVYEMFRNVVKALVLRQPHDPLRFIVWYLKRGRHVDVPKIVMIAPPTLDMDKVYVALNLAKSTGAVTIDRRNVLRRCQRKRDCGDKCPEDFATVLVEYMKAKGAPDRGWILLGIPTNEEEADRLISLGIIPTHTLVFNSDGESGTSHELDRSYKNTEFGIKTKFRSTLKELRVRHNSVEEITESCLEVILRQRPVTTPFVPRVVLIGPEGSKRFVTAMETSKRFAIVHVDFYQILARKKIDNEFTQEMTVQYSWLKDRMTRENCAENGYVLTGFPCTREDFEWLDSTEFAPNRVIFFAVDFREVFARLENRCVDKYTGTVVSLDQAADQLRAGIWKLERVARYPTNPVKVIDDLRNYRDHLREMLYYCGDNCSVVSTVYDTESPLTDSVEVCIKSASPAALGPRPQNKMPYRLTETLYRKMLHLPFDESTCCYNTTLSENARNLLNVLRDRDDPVKTLHAFEA